MVEVSWWRAQISLFNALVLLKALLLEVDVGRRLGFLSCARARFILVNAFKLDIFDIIISFLFVNLTLFASSFDSSFCASDILLGGSSWQTRLFLFLIPFFLRTD